LDIGLFVHHGTNPADFPVYSAYVADVREGMGMADLSNPWVVIPLIMLALAVAILVATAGRK
jgi:hypothetical protein